MTNPKNYTRPKTIEEALQTLNRPNTFPLCGGAMALGVLDFPYETVVDLQDISELSKISVQDDATIIGSAAKLQDIINTPEIPTAFKRALTRTIPDNIRNNTSILETLTIDRIPAEWLALLAACNVQLKSITSTGETLEYSFTETEFVAGKDGRNLQDGLLISITIPHLQDGEAIGTAFIARTPAGDPIVNAAVIVKTKPDKTIHWVFGALCGVSERNPVEVLSLGDLCKKTLTEETITKQAEAVPHVINPPTNYLGSAKYRKAMAATLIKRALEDAAAQL